MAELFDSWAIVEVMGHRRFSGRVTEQSLGGTSFVRVDVPATKRTAPFTKLLGAGSIYCVTPCTEEIARADAETNMSNPLSELSLPSEMREALAAGRKLLSGPKPIADSHPDSDGDYDDDDEFDDCESDK